MAAATSDDGKRGAARRTERGGNRTRGKGRQEGSDEEEAGKRCTRTTETRDPAAAKTHDLAGASLFFPQLPSAQTIRGRAGRAGTALGQWMSQEKSAQSEYTQWSEQYQHLRFALHIIFFRYA